MSLLLKIQRMSLNPSKLFLRVALQQVVAELQQADIGAAHKILQFEEGKLYLK